MPDALRVSGFLKVQHVENDTARLVKNEFRSYAQAQALQGSVLPHVLAGGRQLRGASS